MIIDSLSFGVEAALVSATYRSPPLVWLEPARWPDRTTDRWEITLSDKLQVHCLRERGTPRVTASEVMMLQTRWVATDLYSRLLGGSS